MKKIIFIVLLSLLGNSSFLKSQVYVNVPNVAEHEVSADFQVDPVNTKKGVALPLVELTSIDSYSPIVQQPKPGLLVYNITINEQLTKGYYYWATTPTPHWEKMGGTVSKYTILQDIDENILGYSPTALGASAPSAITIGGSTATKTRCMKWELSAGGNGHTYCGYTIAAAKDFTTTFNAIKAMNAYMVTITSDSEWDFVKTNIINYTTTPLNNPIWIGYVSLATPGNAQKYRWITNETWSNNWGNTSSVQATFASGNPAAATSGRCSLIAGNAYNANRQWYSAACTNTAFQGANINHVIVEFNQ